MNEQASTRLVQQAYQSVKTGDFKSFLNALGEDVQRQLPDMENVPFAGTWRGREEIGRFFSTVAQAQDVIEFEPEDFYRARRQSGCFGPLLFTRQIYGQSFRLSLGARLDRQRWQSHPDTAVSRAHTVAPTG